jgi:hypothetical protein
MGQRPKFARVVNLLQDLGLLLQQDKSLPNIVTLLTGDTLTGSWWKHPKGRTIFQCLVHLSGHPEVLFVKLISGKVTLVHQRLWPEILAVATGHEPWQLKDLPREALQLYKEVEKRGEVLASGPCAKQLERRLLVHGQQEHTDAGHHETRLETWSIWAQRVSCKSVLSPQEGQEILREAVLAIGGTGGELPWEQPKSKLRK